MPSGLNSETLTKIMVGPAVLKVAGVVWGTSRGGIRCEIGATIRNVPFDGKVADIAGLDRVVAYTTRVTGTFLQFGDTDLLRLEHGIASVAVGSVDNTTPITAQQFFVTGNYVEDVQFDLQQADGTLIRIEMPLALIEYSVSGGASDDEATIDISFLCRIDPDATDEPELDELFISPSTPGNTDEGDTQAFTVTGEDQFDDPFDATGGTWSVIPGTGTGSIDGSGVFTAGTAGTVTIRYTKGSVFDEVSWTVDDVASDPLADMVTDAGGDSAVRLVASTHVPAQRTSSGGTCSIFDDARGSSFGVPIEQATSGAQPTDNTATTPDQLEFDGSTDWMTTAYDPTLTQDQVRTLFFIGSVEGGGGWVVGHSNSAARYVGIGSTGTNIKLSMDSSVTIDTGVAIGTTMRGVAVTWATGTGQVVKVRVVGQASWTSGTTDAARLTQDCAVSIGAVWLDGSFKCQGKVIEVWAIAADCTDAIYNDFAAYAVTRGAVAVP